jgi:hypothetical protein
VFKRNESRIRIRTVEMRFVRRKAGYTLSDYKKDLDIMNELNTKSIV